MVDSSVPRIGEPVNRGSPNPSTGGFGSVVAARPSEYEDATMRWMYQTVDTLMRARDPVYARIGCERVESLPDMSIELPDGQDMLIEPFRVSATGTIEIEPAIAGDFDDLHTVVSSIADQRLEQTMRALFAQIIDITQRTGNTINASGDAAEGLLALMEKMDMQFDEHGKPALQMIVSPADEHRVRAQLAALTPDQQRRLAEIINRKREAYRASRRRRRLPRYSH
jgi:hypothetical protein